LTRDDHTNIKKKRSAKTLAMQLIPKVRRKSRVGQAALWGALLAILFISLHSILDDIDARRSSAALGKLRAQTDKILRCQHQNRSDLALPLVRADWKPTVPLSFLRFDRKQNLLLWPVVGSGVVRSPPASHPV